MAKNLIDALRQQMQTRQTANAAPSSAGIQDRMNRKQTGKAGMSSGPSVQSSQAVAANAGLQTQLDQQSQQSQIASQNLGIQQEAQQTQQEQQQLNQQQQGDQIQQQAQQKQAELLGELNRNMGQLDQQQAQFAMEQLGATLALQDQKYLHALQMEGSRRRLDNANDFRVELQASIFKDMETVLSDKIELDKILKANDREFTEWLGQMDINSAIEMANSQAKNAAFSQVVSGIGSAAGSIFSSKVGGDKNEQ